MKKLTLNHLAFSGLRANRKEEQYRMLRTIGATRRQIRAKLNGRCLDDPSVSPGLTTPFTQGSLCTVRSRNCSSEPICFL